MTKKSALFLVFGFCVCLSACGGQAATVIIVNDTSESVFNVVLDWEHSDGARAVTNDSIAAQGEVEVECPLAESQGLMFGGGAYVSWAYVSYDYQGVRYVSEGGCLSDGVTVTFIIEGTNCIANDALYD